MRENKGRFKNVCTTKFVWWAIQCTSVTKGEYQCWIWTIIPNLRPWKALTPLAPKQTSLVANSFSFKPPCVIKEFIINNVKLLASRKHLLDIQQQWYSTPILHNITMHTCPTCIVHGCNSITSKRYKLGILDINFSYFSHFMVYVFCHFPASPVRLMFFGHKSKF